MSLRPGGTACALPPAIWKSCSPEAPSLCIIPNSPNLSPKLYSRCVAHHSSACARFKGPTRLGISNLFGLIPAPLRSAWHGANITDFATVCCDIAKLYGCLFPMFGLVEAFHSAVRWDRKGLYRSRWGNYDIVLSDGIATLSEGLPEADILASRLQGQDVSRSAFFDVVKHEFGWPESAASQPLPLDVQTRLS